MHWPGVRPWIVDSMGRICWNCVEASLKRNTAHRRAFVRYTRGQADVNTALSSQPSCRRCCDLASSSDANELTDDTSRLQESTRAHSTASIGRLPTRHGGGTSTSQIIVRRAADTVTDRRQKLHGSWTARGCGTICRSNFDSGTQVLNSSNDC